MTQNGPKTSEISQEIALTPSFAVFFRQVQFPQVNLDVDVCFAILNSRTFDQIMKKTQDKMCTLSLKQIYTFLAK